ncbi:MAG: ABC transporter permease [Burkholderiales bacterium PBB1]|nr:MAG: ABC transporter permease [Burkholderiales bacterium PBB1]
MLSLLTHLTWPEWRHHPWRQAAALLAVTLGVALAFSVQLINQSALGEFSAAVRSINGEPDFELRGQRGGFDEALYARVARHPDIALASPVIEVETQALVPTLAQGDQGNAKRVPLRVLGIDALVAAPLSPALLPKLSATDGSTEPDRLGLFDPDAVALNAAARQRLGAVDALRLQTPNGVVALQVHGSVAAGGPPLAVMDIAGAQAQFGMLGRLSRIDVRLKPGADRDRVVASLQLQDFASQGVRATTPDEAAQRVSNVSRAYRVNLTVLALVALFTGAFLVFSILSLSVAQRQPQFALLGVLGLGAAQRLRLVLAESALLGVAGSLLGLALGTALAAAALRLLAGDLGGGYFPGVAPVLHFSAPAALAYGALGVAAALVGGWLPARAAQRLAPAQALKGLGTTAGSDRTPWAGPALIAASLALLTVPPVFDMPLAAYVSVALLLLGGIVCVPGGVGLLLRAITPPRHALALLAVERARHQRNTATVAVAGVVASLALSVALTVMVASFRESITSWLDTVLPADLYARASASAGGSDLITLAPGWVRDAAGVDGVARTETLRVSSVQIDPAQPAVALIARPLADPARALPLVGELVALPQGETAAYVSEAMVTLYGAAIGTRLMLPLPNGQQASVFVRGVWRDYARQHGAVVLAAADWLRLTGDTRINDLALWLQPGTDASTVQRQLRALAPRHGMDGELIEFASAAEIRAISLRIFDRSFAVTYWLQGVAIAIGLFGIAASFSAQVLARRKEFGLLAHLGLTRRQVLTVVTAEGAVWTAAGALWGLALGIAVSVVLVKVVNPQSFHWTMDLMLPGARLATLCAAVIAAGTLTAGLAARRAAGRDMALAVKEDW